MHELIMYKTKMFNNTGNLLHAFFDLKLCYTTGFYNTKIVELICVQHENSTISFYIFCH